MKILQVNKFFHTHGKAGGAGTYLFRLIELLESKGHTIIPFATKEKYTRATPYARYFARGFDLGQVRFGLEGLGIAGRIIYSIEAKRKIKQLIKDTKPDIAHLHNVYHHISPSILSVLKKYNIPIVHTLHDYKLICPNYRLFTQGAVCERCNTYRFYQAIIHKCLNKSLFASSLACLEMYLHRGFHIYEKNVDAFIVTSKFVKDEMIKFKVSPKKLNLIPYFLNLDEFKPNYSHEPYFIYLGRLIEEKGVKVLINAMQILNSKKFSFDFKLYIVGTGPQEKELKRYVKDNKINNIEFLGHKSGNELKDIVQKAMFCVVPSVWYEPFGQVVIESYAYGKPVIASNLGGITELVIDGQTGLLFKPRDVNDLANKIGFLINNKERILEMGRQGREMAESKFGKEKHYTKLMEVYQRALSQHLST